MKNKIINVGLVQQSYTGDIQANREKNISAIRRLSYDGANLIVLSELHDGPYFCQTEDVDIFELAHSLSRDESPVREYAELAKELKVVLVTSFFERRSAGLYHNTAVVLDIDGSIAGKYRKMHIPDDPGYYEKFYFTPGDMGFNPIQTSLGKLGVLVCWDQWYPEAARLMAMAGAEMLIYPTAIGYDARDTDEEKERQRQAWITVQRGHAVANGLPVVSVNRVGTEVQEGADERGIGFWGSSFIAGPQGEMLTQLPEDKPALIITPVDMSRSEQVRRWWPFLRDRRIDNYEHLTKRFID